MKDKKLRQALESSGVIHERFFTDGGFNSFDWLEVDMTDKQILHALIEYLGLKVEYFDEIRVVKDTKCSKCGKSVEEEQ